MGALLLLLLLSVVVLILSRAEGRRLLEENVASCRGGGYAKVKCIGDILARKVLTPDHVLPVLCEAEELRAAGAIEDCHMVSHDIGHAAYQAAVRVTPFDRERALFVALQSCDDSLCLHGCTHGVLISRVAELWGDKVTGQLSQLTGGGTLEEALVALCKHLPVGTSHYTCTHGVGHGLGHGIMDISTAEDLCQSAKKVDSSFQHGCSLGLMMEHVWGNLQLLTLSNDKASADKDAGILATTCGMFADTQHQLSSCAMHVGEGLMLRARHDLDKVLPYCDSLPPSGKKDCEEAAKEEQSILLTQGQVSARCSALFSEANEIKIAEAGISSAADDPDNWLKAASGGSCLWPRGSGADGTDYTVAGERVTFYPPPGMKPVKLAFCGDVLRATLPPIPYIPYSTTQNSACRNQSPVLVRTWRLVAPGRAELVRTWKLVAPGRAELLTRGTQHLALSS
mmetsp:Transcript_6512/g.22466  ORF Transcript_6512/g.22466 Transcript_6512/m.22466 type:complete len:454 (+) Transcript_6512:34-1395(+)